MFHCIRPLLLEILGILELFLACSKIMEIILII